MTKKLIRCNTSIATANISKKNMHVGKVNGKDLHAEYFVIENVSHMISGAVMNGLRYGDKIFDKLSDNLMKSNARIPAPLSHPSDDKGNFVDANDPITFSSHNIGAFDTDWRVSGDKLVSNTYIPVDSINNSKEGNEWLSDRVNNKQAIDRSTGLYLNVEESEGYGSDGEPYYGDVTEIFELNHSAILNPDVEPGAKNNGEGVGMFTNSKGLGIEIEEVDIQINASTPALKLPLAPESHVFNESIALNNIKSYTNSTEKPSTSYRKFFLNFDQSNVDSFDSYNNLFADVIDGVPHAIKSQVSNVENEHAKAYVNRFNSEMNNNTSVVKSAINKLFKLINGTETKENNTDFVYRGENGKLYMQQYNCNDSELVFFGEAVEVVKIANEYKPIINNNGDRIMRDKILAALTAANVQTEGLDDDALFAAYNDLNDHSGEDKTVANTDEIKILISEAVTNAVKPLQEQLNANTNKELSDARNFVASMNKGIDQEMADTMTLEHCNKYLAANGHVALNAHSVQLNNSDDGVTAALPE